MSKFYRSLFIGLLLCSTGVFAQQVANSNFEDWSGATFNGEAQPKGWNASHVEQVGLKFNFAHKETGRSGYCLMVQDQEVGAMGITETSPGYFALGQPWQYLPGITSINKATAGTYGGINWTARPDSMSVWIKRTGNNTDKEDFYLLYYSWNGTFKGTSYKGKDGSCTSYSATNEESDVRQALDANECSTTQRGNQVSEGMWREKKTYGQWTNIRVPIYYLNSEAPTMMNIIFSASNYPNFRANDGLYTGNSLYVDDVELIYSSKIHKIYIDDKEWKGFDPNSTAVQTYSLGESATAIPNIEARRGVGSITNAHGKTVQFAGRILSGSEISIEKGDLVSKPTKITVKSEDGKSTTTYQIQFQKAASSNTKLADIKVNGTTIDGFSPSKYNYTVDLPYGTTSAPTVTAEKQEDAQAIEIKPATSPTGTATITVTAANKTDKATYTLTFRVAALADNTLQDIKVNGKSIPGFTPSQAVYKVSLPENTTSMPTVEAVSAYPAGAQTITHIKPSVIDGGTYQISVTTPGNSVPKVYKLNFKLEKSSYTYLKDLQVEGGYIKNFDPANFTYYVNLPMGTTKLPKITYTRGDEYQTVDVSELGEGVVDGTVRVTVTAGNGDQSVYKIVFSTEKSSVSTLSMIYINGQPLEGFEPDVTTYTYQLPIGTTEIPEVTVDKGDEYQNAQITQATSLNGKARITVTAGDGSTTVYQITFSLQLGTDATLKSITVGGVPLEGFDPEKTEYYYNLPQGTTDEDMPEVLYEKNADYQAVTVRNGGINGDYKITVRPQSGNSRTYIIHFSVATSSNTSLAMIYLDGQPLAGFQADIYEYSVDLPEGVSKDPNVTFEKAETSQRVLSVLENHVQTITVTAQSGAKKEYIITFNVQVSENAFLNMIYLDGKPLEGFVSNTLNYTVPLAQATCPEITVDKAPGQQVTITAPYATGEAKILVKPELGAANEYTITFEAVAAATVRLNGILVGGTPISGFVATKAEYDANYEKVLPEVQGVKADDSQSVKVLWKDSVAMLQVNDTLGNTAIYTVAFHRQLSSNAVLKAILVDGAEWPNFNPAVLHYDSTLAAGSAYPEVRYLAADSTQVVFFGQEEAGKWAITVLAENGAKQTYTVRFSTYKYSDATLKNLSIEGYTLVYDSAQTEYSGFEIGEGETLPRVTATPKAGQSVMVYNANDSTQKVLVFAQDSTENIYTIKYARIKSNNVKLANLLIDGKPLLGFDPDTLHYTIPLSRGTKVVPNVNPVAQLDNQTVTTYVSRPNGVTRIHVEAQDGSTGDYTIDFPIEKSQNTKLGSLIIDGESKDVNTTEYEFTVPFGTVEPYDVKYEKAEEEQLIRFVDAPLSGVTRIIVTSQTGDVRTYSIRYTMAEPQGENKVQKVKYSYVIASGDTVHGELEPTAGNNEINLPYGTKAFTVDSVAKNYAEQTIHFYDGGIRRGATIIAVANRSGEEDVTYTITPKMPAYDTKGKLSSLKFKGADVPKWRPDVYNYMINVTAQPTAADFTYTTYEEGKSVTVTAIDAQKKQITFTVAGGEKYSVCWFYTADEWPFTYERVQTERANWYSANLLKVSGSELSPEGSVDPTGYKPKGWMVPADLMAYVDFYAVVSHFSYYTGHEVSVIGDKEIILSTLRGGALNSSMPGTMTLGRLSLPDGVRLNGKTKVSFERNLTNAVQYRNTPEQFAFEYQPIMNVGIGNWNAWVALGNASGSVLTQQDISGSYAGLGTWQTKTTNLSYSGTVGKLNIMLCASEVSGSSYNTYDGSEAKSCDLQIRNMRMVYSSELTGVSVNGKNATKSGNTFTYTLAANEDIVGVPALKFTGKVHDQTQTIEWLNNGEWINGELKAQVVNYGENALVEGRDSTIYTVVLKRATVTSLDYTITYGTYTETVKDDTVFVQLPYGTKKFPEIIIEPESIHQRFDIEKKGNAVTVKVTAEDGNSKTTVYVFRESKGTEAMVESWSLESGTLNTVDAENLIYSVAADKLPVVEYTKQQGQTVDINYTNDSVTMLVTAADGVAQRTYTIRRVNPTVATSGKISEFAKDNNPWAELGGDNYSAEGARSNQVITYIRKDDADSVVYIQTPDSMVWQVYGTENHTYVLRYPATQSANTDLADLLVGGTPYPEFSTLDEEFVIISDTLPVIEPVGAEQKQTLRTTQKRTASGVEYVTEVEAENGVKRTYKVRVTAPQSNIATLAGIMLDSVLIEGFMPEKTSYTVTLPVPEVKKEQPQMPSVTYITGQEGQKVTIEPAGLGEQILFTVESEDGTATLDYDLTIQAQKSHCTELSGIIVNGNALEEFEKGRHFYSRSLHTNAIEIDYTSDDRFQTVTVTADTLKAEQHYIYTLHVKAEDGATAQYEVTIFVENQSTDDKLANIMLNGKDFTDFERALNSDLKFDPGQNNYIINLPSGTTVLPEVSAQLKMEGQSVNIEQKKDSVLLTVTAADNIQTNVYTLHFVVPLSTNYDLSMIYLNGDSLKGFNPIDRFYQVELEVGEHTLPEVDAQKTEAAQKVTVDVDAEKLQATIHVVAEDTTRKGMYVIAFHFNQSDADTLALIYEDGDTIPGFRPDSFYYAYSLPVGTTAFPDLSWDEADEWQTIKMDTIDQSAEALLRQISVVAESGKKNVYTVSYNILKSSVDTLQAIFIGTKPLEGFSAQKVEYNYQLTATQASELNGALPEVDYIAGDEYQTVLVSQAPETDTIQTKTLAYKSLVTVTAATGRTRTYTIHYPVELSSETLLNMILVGGKPLSNFDPERMNYKEEIAETAAIPLITWARKDNLQTVDLIMDQDTVSIVVTAENGDHSEYKITFERQKSANTLLRDIILRDADGEVLPTGLFAFRPEIHEYEIILPYDPEGTYELPAIEAVCYDSLQVVTKVQHDLPDSKDVIIVLHVTAANGEDEGEYSLNFHFTLNNDSRLTHLYINGEEPEGFDSAETEYDFVLPYGSSQEDYVTTDAITYELSDSLANATLSSNEDGTIFIRVVAQDGKSETTYVIRQRVGKDNDCSLATIMLDSVEIPDFDSETTFYTYYLMNGQTPPEVTAEARSENAEVSIRPVSAGDTCMILCTAMDGSTRRYYIHFAVSEINADQAATGSSVLLKRVPGACQLFVATIRKDVTFFLYDQNGHLLFTDKVPVANPNDVEVYDDANAQEVLNNVPIGGTGLTVDIIPGQIYFYGFVSGGKVIQSGKTIGLL